MSQERELDQIAVVGMAGRFPKAETLEAFWRNLREGVECISALSEEELRAAGVHPAFLADPTYVRAQAMLEGFDRFDAAFFGFSPREAEITNPQHRLFLECCHQALEDAGIDPARCNGMAGVFASCSSNTYILDLFTRRDILRNVGGLRVQIANEKEFLPTWVSYKLDLRGPSVNVQTACSSSLVAVHMACQSLLNGECDLALAGGVSVRSLERRGYFYQEGSILSPDGHCRAFDAAAAGTVDGDGGGVVVLKRLVEALEDGDNIRAVILGSAVNNDGGLKVGFTAPSEEGQTRVISEALSIAGIAGTGVETLGYVEAHGTGTRMGDPIEVAALTAALGSRTEARGFCALGSVKTNLGHLDAAAGVTGLIKAVLALEHRELPPSLHFQAPNPEIDFAASPVYVNAALQPWKATDQPRRAGVSSFGIGGTNAHVVLEEAPEVESGPSREHQLLAWSAKTGTALETATRNLSQALASLPLADAAYTLKMGRKALEHRRALVCRDAGEAVAALESGRFLSGHSPAGPRPVAFLFPGQGAQQAGATREIYESEEVFRAEVDRCAELLRPHLGAGLREVLFQGEPQTAWAQPALFVTGYALARLWMSWGVRPQAMIGHSLGEYVAACLAGVLRLEDALALVAARGKLMQDLPAGGMLAVPLGEAEVSPLLGSDLSLAAVNGPRRTVVSGPWPAIEEFERTLAARGVEGKRLRTSHAFHSAMMEPVLPAFAERLRKVRFGAPEIPYIAGATGDWIAQEQAADPDFWLRQLREPVRFGDGVGRLLRQRDWALLEVGPGRTLSALVQQHPDLRPEHLVVSSLSRSSAEGAALLEALGSLWVSGAEVDWTGFYQGETRRRVSLPTYPFERQRYFIERPAGAGAAPWTELAARQELAGPLENETMRTETPEPPRQTGRHEALVSLLKEVVQDLTGMPPERLDPHATFLDIGVDSLLLIQAAQRLRERFGVQVSVVQFLEDLPTLDSVAGYIERELPTERLAEVMGEPSPPTPLSLPPTHPGGEAPPPYSPPALANVGAGLAPTREGTSPSPTLGSVPGGEGLTQLFSQQLQVLSNVVTQQLQILQGGAAVATPPPAVAAPAPPVVTPPAPAPATYTQAGPFHPIERRPQEALQPRQQEYLERFIRRYTARTAKSKEMTEAYRPVLADGRGTVAFRRLWKEMVYPIHSQRSKGSRIWDADGNEYVDINMGFGLHFFGHSPDFLMEALERQMRQGLEVGPQPALAGKVAGLIRELTGMDRSIVCTSGTEAVQGALRVARTVTGRGKVAIFSGSYHGWSDTTFVRPPAPGRLGALPGTPGISAKTLEDVVVLEYGSPAALEQIEALGPELAAVLIEPVRSRTPELQPREFLHALRQVTRRTGTVLIFDEIITGFRIHPGGAQAWFGVEADLATYGKLIGGGLPIGILSGRSAFMDALDGGAWRFGDDSFPQVEKTLFTGTFFKHPLTLAAAAAVLERLRLLGPGLQEELNARTARLAADLNAWLQASSVPMEVVQFGSLFRFRPAPEMRYPELFYFHLVDHGLYFTQESGNCFLSTAHTDEDVEKIQEAVRRSVDDLRESGFLPAGRSAPVPGRRERAAAPPAPTAAASIAARRAPAAVPKRQGVELSLYYFGPYEAPFDPAKYELLVEGARFADEHGFSGIWLPERHFHPFGGLSPNPAVVAAALARETKRLKLRAGSVVVPLHHPVRLAEEWSVVDNLSGGRAGVSFASGWNANDFVFTPHAYENRYEVMYEGIEKIRSLWRGERIRFRDGEGYDLEVLLHPLPHQREIPIWLTAASKPTFAKAGELGAGVLTNLQGQSLAELADKLEAYYDALARHGHDPASGRVTLLLHTFVDPDLETARAKAARPLRAYLRSSFELSRKLFESHGHKIDLDRPSASDLDYIVDVAYERYVADHALVGTPATCAAVIERLIGVGVTEIGCLIDFGIETPAVLASLPWLDQVRERFAGRETIAPAPAPPVPMADELPVPDNQRILWIGSRMGPNASRAYNEPLALRLRGRLDIPALKAAVQGVSDRHPALRASFIGDGTRQRIDPPSPVQLPLIDLAGLAGPRLVAELRWCLKALGGHEFDLSQGPLLRVSLVRAGAEDHYLSLAAHHIVIDGGSAGVMVRELCLQYTAFLRGEPNPLGPAGSYANWIHQTVSRSEADPDQRAAEAYWRELFARPVSLIQLPVDRPRPRSLPFWGDRRQHRLEPGLVAAFRRLSNELRSTPFATGLAVQCALLHHITRQDDVIVGVPSRDPSVTGPLVGYFINLLPVRMEWDPREGFATYLGRVKKALLGAQEHQNYPLNRLLDRLGLAGGLDGFIIGTTFNLERVEEPPKMLGLETEYVWVYPDTARIDLHVNVIEESHTGGGLLEASYRTVLFDPATMDRWLFAYIQVLGALAEDPRRSLESLPVLSPAQRQQLLAEWNDTRTGDASVLCLHELFAEHAARRPQAPALALGGAELCYGDLDRLSTRLAGTLASQGVGPEVRVGVCLERSFELIVSLLAILKAGGVYVPLEPTQPTERLLFLLQDSGTRLLLTRGWVIEKLGEGLGRTGTDALDLDAGWPEDTPALPADLAVDPDNLAYVIYTSGSTGGPNGVLVSHRSTVNLFRRSGELYGVGPQSRVSQLASLGFDASVLEIFLALAHGGCLCLVREEDRTVSFRLAESLERHRVTTVFLTPSALSALPEDALAAVGTIGVGGEASSADLVERWSRGRRLLNCYGPTEATIYATAEVFEDEVDLAGKTPAIGRPVAGIEVHLVDHALRPVPIGVVGEIAIGGAGVARGYLGRFEKTAEKFVPDPFGPPGARLYRTGDLARRRADGRIEFQGRADGQVKLRGFRIELGEIEAALTAQPGVREAVVDLRGEGTSRMLGAYVAWEEGWPDRDLAELRKRIAAQLPDYMVPASWIEVQALPWTANGKLDRLALRALQEDSAKRDLHEDPRTALERFLADLWREVLKVERLSIHDHFLALGGNSINGAMLAYHLQEAIGENMHAIVVFDAPTVADLARFLAVRYPDKVIQIWGDESLPEDVREAILEFESVAGGVDA